MSMNFDHSDWLMSDFVAQSILDEKAKKVLQDVVKAMFSTSFIEELFKPQSVYTISSTKQIFEKLAHSSIMRLNKSSMDKLFDLMTMGFKYQLLQCNSSRHVMHMLLLHLESIKELIGISSVTGMVQSTIDLAIQTYTSLTVGQWESLKQCIFRFIQGKKIKVSLFLQHRMQTMDGTLVIDSRGRLPFGTDPPRIIKYYEGGQVVSSNEFLADTINSENLLPYLDILDYESTVGINMYLKGYLPETRAKEPLLSSMKASQLMRKDISTSDSVDDKSSARKSVDVMAKHSTFQSAKIELNILADLLGVNTIHQEKASSTDSFKINLFPSVSLPDSKASSDPNIEDASFIVFDIDGTADSKSVQQYLDDLDFRVVADDKNNDMDDLLSLMDRAK